jgi:hypothetical protein
MPALRRSGDLHEGIDEVAWSIELLSEWADRDG